MALLITNGFDIQSGVYQQPSSNATAIYYTDKDLILTISITPDTSTYGECYGSGNDFRYLYLYLATSKNADLSGGTASHLATWTAYTGRFTYQTTLTIPANTYFNLYFAFYRGWRTSYRHKVWRAYGWEYETRYNDHRELQYHINVANFENLMIEAH